MRKGAPMALSEKDVRGIAEYAKIALTDDELAPVSYTHLTLPTKA